MVRCLDPCSIAKRFMIAKFNLLLVALLPVALLQPAGAEDTLAENFTAAHRTLPFGTLVRVEH